VVADSYDLPGGRGVRRYDKIDEAVLAQRAPRHLALSQCGRWTPELVIRYIERYAQDWSPGTGKTMCWSLRAARDAAKMLN